MRLMSVYMPIIEFRAGCTYDQICNGNCNYADCKQALLGQTGDCIQATLDV